MSSRPVRGRIFPIRQDWQGMEASRRRRPEMIAKEDLKKNLKANLDDILLIDVRKESDWNGSDRKILRAIREDPNEVAIWAARFPMDRPVVVYCACARGETSSRVALQLRDLGFADVSVLKGGWREWAAAEYPTVKKDESVDEARPRAS